MKTGNHVRISVWLDEERNASVDMSTVNVSDMAAHLIGRCIAANLAAFWDRDDPNDVKLSVTVLRDTREVISMGDVRVKP